MTTPIVKIQIHADGPSASGKSLAISDMIRGLRDNGHFIVNDRVVGMISQLKEYQEIELQLKHSVIGSD